MKTRRNTRFLHLDIYKIVGHIDDAGWLFAKAGCEIEKVEDGCPKRVV